MKALIYEINKHPAFSPQINSIDMKSQVTKPTDLMLLDSHIRDKQTFCNITADN